MHLLQAWGFGEVFCVNCILMWLNRHPFGGSADKPFGEKRDGNELSCVTGMETDTLRQHIELPQFWALSLLASLQMVVAAHRKKDGPCSKPQNTPWQELHGAVLEASLVPRPASGGGGLSPATPSHQTGPAAGFHR